VSYLSYNDSSNVKIKIPTKSVFWFCVLIATLYMAAFYNLLGMLNITIQLLTVILGITTIIFVKVGIVNPSKYFFLLFWSVYSIIIFNYFSPSETIFQFGIGLDRGIAQIISVTLILLICMEYTKSKWSNEMKYVFGTLIIAIYVNAIFLLQNVIVHSEVGRRIEQEGLEILPFFANTYGLAILFPIFLAAIYFVPNKKQKLFFLLTLMILFITIMISGYVTAFLATMVGVIAYYILRLKIDNKLAIIYILLIMFLFYIIYLTDFLPFVILLFKDYLDIYLADTALTERLNDIALYLKGMGGRTVEVRLNLYNMSIDSFLQYPLLGGAIIEKGELSLGRHATFFDMLGRVGIVGTLPFILFIISNYMECYKKWKGTVFMSIVNSCYIIFIIFFTTKSIVASYTIYISTFILVPALIGFIEKNIYKKQGEM